MILIRTHFLSSTNTKPTRAETLDEAIDKLEHDSDIQMKNIEKDIYVEGSFEVNIDFTREMERQK